MFKPGIDEVRVFDSDFPQDLLDDLALYYGIGNPNFIAYLDSLGFRYRDGTLKAAWDVLLKEAVGGVSVFQGSLNRSFRGGLLPQLW